MEPKNQKTENAGAATADASDKADGQSQNQDQVLVPEPGADQEIDNARDSRILPGEDHDIQEGDPERR